MRLSIRIFLSAALLCAGAWIAKTALIASNGGTQADGGFITILWATGMIALFTSAAAGAVAAFGSRSALLRGIAAMVAVALSFIALNVVDGVVKSVYPGDTWFRDEVALLLVGGLLAACAIIVGTRTAPRRRGHAVA